MTDLIPTRFLNYAATPDNRVLGQVLGPDTTGHAWLVSKVEPRAGGGSRVTVKALSRVYNGATHNDVRQVA